MSDFVDGAMDDLSERLTSAVQIVTNQIRDDIKDLVNDAYPPASVPGSPPHKRTGGYQDSFDVENVTADGDTIHGAAYTDSQLGEWLENGTSRMAARPHVAEVAQKWDGAIIDAIKSEL